MARRKNTSVFEELLTMPWWCSPVVALAAYVVFAHIMPTLLPGDHPAFAAINSVMPEIAKFLGVLFLIPAPFAYIHGRKTLTPTTQRSSPSSNSTSLRPISQIEPCPRCGSELVQRTAKHGKNTGRSFLGCAGFPKCRYTQNV